MVEHDPEAEWRERQIKVARFVQARAIEMMRNATPSQLAALQRAQRSAADYERRLVKEGIVPPTLAEQVEKSYRRWLKDGGASAE